MSAETTDIKSQGGTDDMMDWVLALIQKVNESGRLAPNEASQKRLREMVNTYGSAGAWEAIKQFSINVGMNNALFMEELFHKCPKLPDLFETDRAFPEALNRWFELNEDKVTRFHKVSSAVLRANPVIEWKTDAQSNVSDLTPIIDMLFHNKEGLGNERADFNGRAT